MAKTIMALAPSESRLPAQGAKLFSARHYKGLDGLRGAAFLMVFVFHYALTTHTSQQWILDIARVSEAGWTGVDLFFVLSGFLITGILLDTRDGAHYYRNFYARRSLRILPLYYTVLLVLVALTPLLHLEWHWGHLAYFFYLGNIAGNVDPRLTDVLPYITLVHTWSLAVEEQFYLLWPLIIVWISTSRKLIKLCLALMGFGLVLRILLLLTLNRSSAYEWSYSTLLTHDDGLLLGAVTAVLVRRFPLEVLIRRSRVPGAIAGGVLIGLTLYEGRLNYHFAAMTIAIYPALAVFFSSLLLRCLQPGSVANRIGSLGFLRFFGRYSYGLYIYHRIFAPYLGKFLPVLQMKLHSVVLGGVAFFVLVLGGTIVVSVLSYELYEKQWLRLKSRFAYVYVPSEASASN